MEYETRNLYGGAIKVDIPKNFDDISKIRDVPDHQEVFVDRYSECSIIIELLDTANVNDENKLAEYYFRDISEYNCSKETKIIYSESLSKWSDDVLVSKCYGIQNLEKKYATSSFKEELNLHILVMRIVSSNTDVVISFNNPIRNKNDSLLVNRNFEINKHYSQEEIGEIMNNISKTLIIKDYKLFI